jgi:chromate transporter
MMDWLDLIISFFMANILGYGGGPASIPLMYQEIVNHHHWHSDEQFSSMLSLANTLPGPIATKIASYIGYYVYGWTGLVLALSATIVPSAIALIFLANLLKRHRKSDIVKGMTLLVQPVIAMMMLVLTWNMAITSVDSIGIWHSLGIAIVALWAIQRRKIHPAIVITIAFVYGGVVLSHIHPV